MEDLQEIIGDLHVGGKYIEFYENLQYYLEDYSPSKVESMRSTLLYARPKKAKEIATYDKMRV